MSVIVKDMFEWTFPKTIPSNEMLKITFGPGEDHETLPAADKEGNYHFTIEDSYGNVLVPREQLEKGAYKYDSTMHELQFSDDYAGQKIRVIYDYVATNARVYHTPPIMKKERELSSLSFFF